MKWVAFFGALLIGVPALREAMNRSPKLRAWAISAVCFDLFNPMHINLISQENYRGDSRGIEVTTVDLILLAVRFSGSRPTTAPATRHLFVRALFFTAVVLSFSDTPDTLKSAFSLWKLVRMFVAFDTLATVFVDLALVQAAMTGLGAAVLAQGALVFWQKYGLHAIRTQGSLPHPNSLAMITNMVAPVAFALWLSGRGRAYAPVVVACTAMATITSLSRGGMAMFVLAATLGCVVSFARKADARKLKIVIGLGFAAMLVLAKSLDTIIERFTTAPKESELARVLFNKAAKMMADERPFGVGINMYSYVLEHGGYAARLNIEPGDRSGIAHHIYWLTAAELGYFGAIAYVLVVASVLSSALRLAFRGGLRGDLGVGMTLGLSTMVLQGTAEWIARQTPMAYLFWVYAAMASGLRGSSER
ncbi:MAG: O-antigen ligase family protein [Myxococcales bacterium]|nr:O-antigen ligase family protein [Myxococcales bacterium]